MTYAALAVPAKFTITAIWQYVSFELLFAVIPYNATGLAFTHIFRKNSLATTAKAI